MAGFQMILAILALCVPGTWLMTRNTVNTLSTEPNNKLSKPVAYALIAVQTLCISALSAAAGVYLGPRAGIKDEFLKGLIQGEPSGQALIHQLVVGLPAGIVCASVWIAAYYGFIRGRMDRDSVKTTERIRFQLGLGTRIASGGILEEIIFRWGLLSLTMWILSWIIGSEPVCFWISITVTGVLFGLAHLPGNLASGAKPSSLLVSAAILGNLWVSLFCGYLLWQYGLFSAIIVHILFHVIWYPFDRASYKKISNI